MPYDIPAEIRGYSGQAQDRDRRCPQTMKTLGGKLVAVSLHFFGSILYNAMLAQQGSELRGKLV